jgi:hypothetical protein
MQNWADNTQARSAGVRDRVVRLHLKDNEGGLNLNMPPPLIATIAARGQQAAQVLLRRYLPAASNASAPQAATREDLLPHRSTFADGWSGWDFQRWVRLDVLIRTLADKAPGLVRALSTTIPHGTAYDRLLQAGLSSAPPGHGAPLNQEQAQALSELLKALENVSRYFSGETAGYPDDPIPAADIRVRPTL